VFFYLEKKDVHNNFKHCYKDLMEVLLWWEWWEELLLSFILNYLQKKTLVWIQRAIFKYLTKFERRSTLEEVTDAVK